MIDRRRLIALGPAIAASGIAARAGAQTTGRAPVVGFVSAVGRSADHIGAFEAGLREAGLEPGRSVTIIERYADGNLDVLRRNIDEIAALSPAAFVTAGDNAMRLIQERSSNVPIIVAVLGNYGNVVMGGKINRPPGNTTGFSNLSAELAAKRLDLLRELVPGLDLVAFPFNPNVVNPTGQPEAYRNAAASLGIKLLNIAVEKATDFKAELMAAKAAGARGIVVYRNFLFETMRAELAAAIVASSLPSMFEERFYVTLGGLVCYSPNLADLFRRSAGYAAKVLAGTPTHELPIQLPTKFEMVLNLKAAEALRLTLPPTTLLRADEVIE